MGALAAAAERHFEDWHTPAEGEVDPYRFEYRSAIDARELLDPQDFMYRRARQLVLEKQESAQKSGETEADPLSDLLGGARMAAAFAEIDHPDAEAAYRNHENDIRTAYTEALLKSGHISEIISDLAPTGEAVIGSVAHWEIFLRAAPKSDVEVCTAEVAEEFMSAALYNNPALRDNYCLAIISPPRPDTKGNTTMVRFISFERTAGDVWQRKTSQLYVGDGTVEDANRLLREWGALSEAEADLSETDVLAKPVLLRKTRFAEGVSSAAKMLDTFAGDRLNQPVFCGVPLETEVEAERYDELAAVSKKRESQIAPEVARLARDTYDIVAKKHLSFNEENRAYAKLLLASLRRVCSDHPEYAEAAFGAKAAKHYQEAHERMADGDSAGAEAALNTAYDNSTSVTVCDTTIQESQNPDSTTSEKQQSAEERLEALHCLELKIRGYTIRRGVRCPACYKTTRRKVDAYETVETIRCMSGECGYCINKITGAVVLKSKLESPQQKASREKAERTLISGRSYRLGNTDYYYVRERTEDGYRPRLITDSGDTIRGEAALRIEQAIIALQEMPLLWSLWLN